MEDNGLEATANSRGKTRIANSTAQKAAQLEPSRDEITDELLLIWERLDDAGRADLLAIARRLDAKAVTK